MADSAPEKRDALPESAEMSNSARQSSHLQESVFASLSKGVGQYDNLMLDGPRSGAARCTYANTNWRQSPLVTLSLSR